MTRPILQLHKATIRFGGLTAVSALDLSIHDGDLVGLIGPNGAGKTTVFNLVTSVYPVTSGTIRSHGMDLAGLRPYEIVEAGIVRTFQNIRLFKSLSVFDNVRVACNVHRGAGPAQAFVRMRAFREDEASVRCAGGPRSCWTSSTSCASGTSLRPACPTASSAASRSCAASPRSRSCCSWTSPRPG
jgi:branched-chain amino acid transport system ATP-binding protein